MEKNLMRATSTRKKLCTSIQNKINVNEYSSVRVKERLLYIAQKENILRIIEERHKEKKERK